MGNNHLALCLNKRLARVGSTAVSKGNKNPPRCFISRFLAEVVTSLSATLRSTDFCFLIFCLAQSDTFKFPYNTFRMNSLIQFNSSRLQFEIIALRNLGCADLSTLRA